MSMSEQLARELVGILLSQPHAHQTYSKCVLLRLAFVWVLGV